MKQLFALFLVFVFLITNSCNNSKISLGRKHRHSTSEQAKIEENKSTTVEIESEKNIDEQTKGKDKKTVEGIAIEQIDLLLDEKSSKEFHRKIDKTKQRVESKTETKNLTQKNTKNEESNDRGSAPLIVFGSILLLGGIGLVVYAFFNLENNDGSPEGCLTSLVIATALVILGLLLGVLGLVLLIIGIVAFTSK